MHNKYDVDDLLQDNLNTGYQIMQITYVLYASAKDKIFKMTFVT